MGLEQKIFDDLKEAMKAKEQVRVGVLRMLRAQLKNASIEKSDDLEESDVLAVLSKEAKKRKDAIVMYVEGGRQDLADQEKAELDILSSYLPKALSEEELNELVTAVIEEVGAVGMKDMGRVMGQIMPRTKGRADGQLVQRLVKEKLGS